MLAIYSSLLLAKKTNYRDYLVTLFFTIKIAGLLYKPKTLERYFKSRSYSLFSDLT